MKSETPRNVLTVSLYDFETTEDRAPPFHHVIFEQSIRLPDEARFSGLSVGDANGDGKTDFLAVFSTGGGILFQQE